jgi:cytochrome c-type biogenesis protein CcmH/NrfF
MRTIIRLLSCCFFLGASISHAQPAVNYPEKPQRVLPENPTFDVDARRAQKLADDLKSPFCPGKTLKTCTSPRAAKLRREIQDMVKSGMSDPDIISQLKSVHDRDDFSVTNPDQPFYTIFLPFIPFVILTVAMLFMIRRWQRGHTVGSSNDVEGTSDDNEASRTALRARLKAEDRDTDL